MMRDKLIASHRIDQKLVYKSHKILFDVFSKSTGMTDINVRIDLTRSRCDKINPDSWMICLDFMTY